VPNGTGEKAKGAILQRAVQYILHLKENEARNIEKWTLEKLLMDQAMGDLQAQLEEVRRMWEDERTARLRAENELEVLRGVTGQAAPGQMAGTPQSAGTANVSVKEGSAGPQPQPNGASDSPNDNKRRVREDGDDGDSEDSAKRARVE
jgi:transcriptional regulator CBF1